MGLREDNIGSLEDAALKRKQRLLELKNKNKKKNTDDDQDEEEQDDKEDTNNDKTDIPAPKVLFRNYRPDGTVLSDGVIDKAEPADVDSLVQEQLNSAATAAAIDDHVQLSSLAPKKVTFDLKRCIQDKLDKLERATDRAIVEIIREKLKQDISMSGDGEANDLVKAVIAGTATAGQEEED